MIYQTEPRRKDNSPSKNNNQDEIHGDLFTQSKQTLDILATKYMKAAISYEGQYRIETLPVPETALREAIANAIVHRDYSTGTPIQISVYADKLVIWNSGQLPDDWTVDNLLGKHTSQPFNPAVANTYFRTGEIEAWGRGIERIQSACKKEDAPEPGISLERTGFWMEFPFKKLKQLADVAVKTNVVSEEMAVNGDDLAVNHPATSAQTSVQKEKASVETSVKDENA